MQAAYYEQAGDPQVIQVGECPDPQPQPGQVRVRLATHGVNPTDCKRRSGFRGQLPFPRVIPGFDGAGVIDAVGSGVAPQRLGERVWVWEGAHRKWDGTAAQMVCVPSTRAMPLPDDWSFEWGAGLGVPALTAAQALHWGGSLSGQTVLVTGAAGAVGHLAVQLAAHQGARVMGLVRNATQAQAARDAGAETVHLVDDAGLDEAIQTFTQGQGMSLLVDVDIGSHLERAWQWIAVNGHYSAYSTGSQTKPTLDWLKYMYRNISLHGVAIFEIPEHDKLRAAQTVQQALQDQALRIRVDRVFALQDMAQAHAHQEQGRPQGKVVVQLP